jgi:hypothetical protein
MIVKVQFAARNEAARALAGLRCRALDPQKVKLKFQPSDRRVDQCHVVWSWKRASYLRLPALDVTLHALKCLCARTFVARSSYEGSGEGTRQIDDSTGSILNGIASSSSLFQAFLLQSNLCYQCPGLLHSITQIYGLKTSFITRGYRAASSMPSLTACQHLEVSHQILSVGLPFNM